jgi:hypothetical protein
MDSVRIIIGRCYLSTAVSHALEPCCLPACTWVLPAQPPRVLGGVPQHPHNHKAAAGPMVPDGAAVHDCKKVTPLLAAHRAGSGRGTGSFRYSTTAAALRQQIPPSCCKTKVGLARN